MKLSQPFPNPVLANTEGINEYDTDVDTCCLGKNFRALWGMKSSTQDFRNHVGDCVEHMWYTLCLADPNLWTRKSKMDNGIGYYEYLLLYVKEFSIPLFWGEYLKLS